MKPKKWSLIYFTSLLTLAAAVIGINYSIDPFNIFHSKLLPYQFQMNERFMKIEYLEKNHQKYDSYMFGSSRIGTTMPCVLENYIPDSKFYNLTISGADSLDFLIHLQYFIKQNYMIKNLYLQIDIDSMHFYGHDTSNYLQRPHPYVTKSSLVKFYLEYLTGYFPFNIEGKIKQNMLAKNENEYSLETTGTWSRPKREARLQKNCKEYVLNEPSFHTKHERTVGAENIKKTIAALQKIKQLCDEHNINLYLFTTAQNHVMMDTFKVDDYLAFIKQLSEVTSFYDFSGYNSITDNNCNYLEYSHYRAHVGALIAARIFGDPSVDVPEDFGIHVDKNNVEEHIKQLREAIRLHDQDR